MQDKLGAFWCAFVRSCEFWRVCYTIRTMLIPATLQSGWAGSPGGFDSLHPAKMLIRAKLIRERRGKGNGHGEQKAREGRGRQVAGTSGLQFDEKAEAYGL